MNRQFLNILAFQDDTVTLSLVARHADDPAAVTKPEEQSMFADAGVATEDVITLSSDSECDHHEAIPASIDEDIIMLSSDSDLSHQDDPAKSNHSDMPAIKEDGEVTFDQTQFPQQSIPSQDSTSR